jgi:hypothetical protein
MSLYFVQTEGGAGYKKIAFSGSRTLNDIQVATAKQTTL